MYALVRPKYYNDDPDKGIQCMVIELMPDPEIEAETKGILDLLALLKEGEDLQVRALPPDSFGETTSIEVRGKHLTVDF